jgi:5'-deoxynucleotidase YfbR-like HD superfamily hydrolase
MANSRTFTELDLRLSHVRRWGILRTVRQQSVAEHCFNVALLSERIAKNWFREYDPTTIVQIYQWALNHDHPEALSGDVPTIVKDLLNEEELEVRYGDMIPVLKSDVPDYIRNIVKIADRLDAIIFLRMEESLGNKTVVFVRRSIEDNLFDLFREHWPHIEPQLKVMTHALLDSLFPHDQFTAQPYDRRGF